MKMIIENKGLDTLNLVLTKQHLVIEHDLDDAIIQHYMQVSFDTAESYTNHAITDETYTSTVDENNIYEIKYKPAKVELYNLGVLVKEVIYLDYIFPYITIHNEEDTIYDEVKVYVEGNTSFGITQGRLLQIGSLYKNRENEDFSNMKVTSMATEFLYTLNEGSIL